MDTFSMDEKTLMRKADLLIADGLHEKAICCLDMILKENPNSEYALSLKGLANCLMGEYEKGFGFLEDALEIDPFSKFALITFADAYLRSSMAEKSLDILERAISYYPEDDGFVMLKMVIIGAINRVSRNACLN